MCFAFLVCALHPCKSPGSCPSGYIMPFGVHHALQGANCEVYDSLQSISYGKRFSNTLRGWGCGMIYSASGSISRKYFK